jgi:steroid 5-alpha reductase family enzyme
MSVSLYLLGLVTTLGLATLTWVVSVLKRDVSIVDGAWALMLLAAATVYATGAELYTVRTTLILTLVVLWALRLSGHIIHRNWGEPEDRRYRDIRQKYEPYFTWKSLGLIFWFQAVLAWIISIPLWPALTVPVDWGTFDLLAVTVWTVGMIFEGFGDWQLSRFKADPENQGKVMDRGLWQYTRHPNYFGECLIWWGFSLFAMPSGAWWTIVGPLLLTYMLLKFSGVSLMEQTIVERRPAYRAYITRTNAFIPGKPKQAVHAPLPGDRRHG